MTNTEELLPETDELQTQVTSVDARIYKRQHIRLAAFLGGPLAAGYIIAENYKAFNDFANAKKTWVIALLATIAVYLLSYYLPVLDRVPNIVFPLVYSLIAYQVITMLQGKRIGAYLTAGGEGLAFGWGRVVVVGLVGAAVQIGIVLTVLLATWQLQELINIFLGKA